jgi:membrane associated rhomboid family serine protease
MAQFQFRKFDLIPVIIKNLLIVNALVWLAQITLGRTFPIEDMFALHDLHSSLFRPHQLITHMFMHDPQHISHLLFNMLALWMFGSALENVWGPKRFLIFYLASGLGAAVLHLAVLYYQNGQLLEMFNHMSSVQQAGVAEGLTAKINEPTLGASGAVFGCLAGFGYLFPNTLILVYFLFPIKAKWFVLIYAILELSAGVQASAGDNVAHFAHLGGALVGFLLVYFWNKRNRNHFY